MQDLITYMGYLWVSVEDGIATIGINDDGLEEFTEIGKVTLPNADESVDPDEICGEVDTDQGPMNLYSPVEGQIVEINEAVVEEPSLIIEDPYGDGWLFKVEAKNADDLNELATATTADRDE